MDVLTQVAAGAVVVAAGLLVVANLIKVCIDIYNQWPRRASKK